MALTHLLYLHGFRSSPASSKAQATVAWLAEHRPEVTVVVPQLPIGPADAAARLDSLTAGWPPASSAVMGSSLGGFYAAWVAHERGWPAVLVNPSTDPARSLASQVGDLHAWHDPTQVLIFTVEHLGELAALDVADAQSHPPTLLVAAKGDEVLDWRAMVDRFNDATQIVLEGGDHGLTTEWPTILPQALDFLDAALT